MWADGGGGGGASTLFRAAKKLTIEAPRRTTQNELCRLQLGTDQWPCQLLPLPRTPLAPVFMLHMVVYVSGFTAPRPPRVCGGLVPLRGDLTALPCYLLGLFFLLRLTCASKVLGQTDRIMLTV